MRVARGSRQLAVAAAAGDADGAAEGEGDPEAAGDVTAPGAADDEGAADAEGFGEAAAALADGVAAAVNGRQISVSWPYLAKTASLITAG